MKSGIYGIVSERFSQVYIGFSRSIYNRVRKFRSDVRLGRSIAALKEMGIRYDKGVAFEILAYCSFEEFAQERQRIVDSYRRKGFTVYGMVSQDETPINIEGNQYASNQEWSEEIERLKRFKGFGWTHRQICQTLDEQLNYLENRQKHAF